MQTLNFYHSEWSDYGTFVDDEGDDLNQMSTTLTSTNN